MSAETMEFALSVLKIIWIDLLLSGDNAVVIALACRSLPENQRRWGILMGAGAAILLRILFMFIVVQLLALPYLKLVGGVLLLWIAIQLVTGDDDEHDIKAPSSLFKAVGTIALADVVMSLDNVVAIAAAAKDSFALVLFGIGVSIPLIVFGSNVVLYILDRFPILIWAGAALLGWIAGEMIVSDPSLVTWIGGAVSSTLHYAAACAGAVMVVLIAWLMTRRAAKEPDPA